MSLSDYSSLTDISEDDEAYTPAPKTKKAKEKGQYTIKPILKPPRQTTYSAKALYEQMVEGSIDLNPEYQRGVWPSPFVLGHVCPLQSGIQRFNASNL